MKKEQNLQIKKLTYAGMLLSVGIILPYVAHSFGVSGKIFLPMHIPVLLCGMICGPMYGAILGVILPLISSALTGMPAAYPSLPLMMAELFTYGFVSGVLQTKTPLGKYKFGIYPSLVLSMVSGRVVYALFFRILFALDGALKTATVWTAVATGFVGIIIQLFVIPPVVYIAANASHIQRKRAVRNASRLLAKKSVACVVAKKGKVIASENGRGVAPILRLYENDLLKDATVIDKVVGRAAAMVMTRGGVISCHAVTLSEGAQKWLTEHKVEITYETLVPHIINRQGDGMCPMEQIALSLDSDQTIVTLLKNKLAELTE